MAVLQRLGDYELLNEIERGGMGIVFKARQVSLNRFVAVKLISAGALATPDLVKRFRAEAEAAASLAHPHIVPIYEIGEHQGQHYFSMGLIDGPNLSTRLSHRPMPDLREAAQLLVALGEAVHFAHQRGVLHRDLKPGNVLLDHQSQPHLTDFGLAKVIQGDNTLTRTNAVLGTPAYMSPEQARGQTKEVTTGVDVYGLGAVLYETLTGSAPFGAGTSFETVRQVLEQEPRPPSLLNSAVDRDLETICLKCLEKEATCRYPSAQAFVDDLERWLAHEPIQARPSSALERVGKWTRRRPVVATLTASLALTLLVGGIGLTVAWHQAVGQRQRADQSAVSLRQHLYASDVSIAWHSWEKGEAEHARAELVEAARQGKDLRGFEWRYLWNISRPAEVRVLTNFCMYAKYSPDGRLLAIPEYSTGEVKLWDVASREVIRTIRAYQSQCWNLAFSPNGKVLATCSRAEPDFKLWDVDTGMQIGILTNRSQERFAVTFSPDGKYLATVAATAYRKVAAEVTIWDAASHQALTSLPGLTSWTIQEDFSPDSQTLVCGDGEGLVRLWHWPTGAIRILRGHTGMVFNARFAPDGQLLATCDEKGTIILWDWVQNKTVRVLPGHQGPTYGLAFSRDGRWLGSSGRDHTVRLWQVKTGQESARLPGHSGRIINVDFSPDGQTLVTSGAQDKTIRFWKAAPRVNGEVLVTSQGSSRIGFSPDGRLLFVDQWEANRATLWNVDSKTIAHELSGRQLHFSSDGNALTLIRETNVILVAVATWRPIATIPVLASPAGATAISPDAKSLALWIRGRLAMIDLKTGEQRIIRGEQPANAGSTKGTDSLVFTPDSKSIITADAPDGTIQLWDVGSGQPVASLHGHHSAVNALAISRDGRLLAAASGTTIRLWDLEKRSAANHPILAGGNDFVPGLAFSPDGKTLAAGSFDGPVTLWSIPGRQEIGALQGHLSAVQTLAFSPDGNLLASSSYDSNVRLWRAARLEEIDSSHDLPWP
ncbi:MAG: serine/threonine-protein kinase [Verrucomicrobiota bacterium]